MYTLKLYVTIKLFGEYLPNHFSYNLETVAKYSDADIKKEEYKSDINWFSSAYDSGVFGHTEFESERNLRCLVHRFYGYDYNENAVDAMVFLLSQKETFRWVSFSVRIIKDDEES